MLFGNKLCRPRFLKCILAMRQRYDRNKGSNFYDKHLFSCSAWGLISSAVGVAASAMQKISLVDGRIHFNQISTSSRSMKRVPKHTSKSTMNHLKRCKLKFLLWPSVPWHKHHRKSVDRSRKKAVHPRWPNNDKTRYLLQGWMGESPPDKNGKTLSWRQEALTSCDTCRRECY